MSWVSHGTPSTAHRCRLPDVEQCIARAKIGIGPPIEVGAVWRCDGCRSRWRLHRVGPGGPPNPGRYAGYVNGPDGSRWSRAKRWAR